MMNNSPSLLIVIGNGFDVAHGLHTSYSDFKKYLYENKSKSNLYKSLQEYVFKEEDNLWNKFEEQLSKLKYEPIIEEAECLLVPYSANSWRDTYNHDYKYEIQNKLSFSKDIVPAISEWIKSIDLNEAHSNSVIESLFKENIKNKNTLKVLSFNYTNTIEKLYKIQKSSICYIHGDISQNDNLISGHHDAENALNFKYEESILDDYRQIEGISEIQNYFKQTYKDTKKIILNNKGFFNSLGKNLQNILVIGHSLSEIDLDYFYEIKKHIGNNCKWIVSYYDCEDEEKIHNFTSKLSIKNVELVDLKNNTSKKQKALHLNDTPPKTSSTLAV